MPHEAAGEQNAEFLGDKFFLILGFFILTQVNMPD